MSLETPSSGCEFKQKRKYEPQRGDEKMATGYNTAPDGRQHETLVLCDAEKLWKPRKMTMSLLRKKNCYEMQKISILKLSINVFQS